jgi:hypothetical protein
LTPSSAQAADAQAHALDVQRVGVLELYLRQTNFSPPAIPDICPRPRHRLLVDVGFRREAVDSAGFVDGKPGNAGIRTKSLRELIDCFGNAGTAVRNF